MSNFIHPTAIVSEDVRLGTGNYIGPFCLIGPKVKIGNNNRFEAYCSIGTAPEHKSYWNKTFEGVSIGSNGVFREFITINSGTVSDTLILDGVSMLKGSYAGHDSVLHNDVTLACHVAIGGHCTIYQGANLGLSTVVHQYTYIGQYAMLGMGTVVTKTSVILPFNTYIGNPAKLLKPNYIGIEKSGCSLEEIKRQQQLFSELKKKKKTA